MSFCADFRYRSEVNSPPRIDTKEKLNRGWTQIYADNDNWEPRKNAKKETSLKSADYTDYADFGLGQSRAAARERADS
jgi:hypothetical protein